MHVPSSSFISARKRQSESNLKHWLKVGKCQRLNQTDYRGSNEIHGTFDIPLVSPTKEKKDSWMTRNKWNDLEKNGQNLRAKERGKETTGHPFIKATEVNFRFMVVNSPINTCIHSYMSIIDMRNCYLRLHFLVSLLARVNNFRTLISC